MIAQDRTRLIGPVVLKILNRTAEKRRKEKNQNKQRSYPQNRARTLSLFLYKIVFRLLQARPKCAVSQDFGNFSSLEKYLNGCKTKFGDHDY